MSIPVFVGLAYVLSWGFWLPLAFSGAVVVPGDLIPAVVTAIVMAWAIVIVWHLWRDRGGAVLVVPGVEG